MCVILLLVAIPIDALDDALDTLAFSALFLVVFVDHFSSDDELTTTFCNGSLGSTLSDVFQLDRNRVTTILGMARTRHAGATLSASLDSIEFVWQQS